METGLKIKRQTGNLLLATFMILSTFTGNEYKHLKETNQEKLHSREWATLNCCDKDWKLHRLINCN